MDEERADMMDNDSGGMVDRTTGMEVIFDVPTGVEVAVMCWNAGLWRRHDHAWAISA